MLQTPLSNKKNQKGSLLVEIVIVAGIIVGSLVAILGLAAFFLTTSQIVQQTSQATALAQETLEIARNVRDGAGWAAIITGGPYHPEQSGSPAAWILASGAEVVGNFTRQIMFEGVYRDASDNISSSGTLDPDTIKAIVQVTWQERERNHQVEFSAYFTNWQQ